MGGNCIQAFHPGGSSNIGRGQSELFIAVPGTPGSYTFISVPISRSLLQKFFLFLLVPATLGIVGNCGHTVGLTD